MRAVENAARRHARAAAPWRAVDGALRCGRMRIYAERPGRALLQLLADVAVLVWVVFVVRSRTLRATSCSSSKARPGS